MRLCFSLLCVLGLANPAPAPLGQTETVPHAPTAISRNAVAMPARNPAAAPSGEEEAASTPGFGIAADISQPLHGWNPDLYAALDYDFDAGGIHYTGHYFSGAPASAGDTAVFNQIGAGIGLGYRISGIAIALIPYAASGDRGWNRNIATLPRAAGFYQAGLLGDGMRLDLPVTPSWVTTFNGEILGLAGGSIASSFGASGAQRVSLGLDNAFNGRLHFIGSLYWQHFIYSGSRPQFYDFDATVGVAYSFY